MSAAIAIESEPATTPAEGGRLVRLPVPPFVREEEEEGNDKHAEESGHVDRAAERVARRQRWRLAQLVEAAERMERRALRRRRREEAQANAARRHDEATVPNLLSAVAPPRPWLDLERALGKFFGLRPAARTEDGERRELFDETLARFHEACVADPSATGGYPPPDVVMYARGIARHVLRDMLDERRRKSRALEELLRARSNRGSRKQPSTRAGSSPLTDVGAVEDARIACLDGAESIPLTLPFERDEFWTRVHDYCAAQCRKRFGLSFSWRSRELRAAELPSIRIHGRSLEPIEATWLHLLSIRCCPSELSIRSDTTPETIVEAHREAVKKAFFRNDIDVPERLARKPTVRVKRGTCLCPAKVSQHECTRLRSFSTRATWSRWRRRHASGIETS